MVSDLLDIHWYIGMPMNQSQPARLEVIEAAEPILGDFIKASDLSKQQTIVSRRAHSRFPVADVAPWKRA